MRLSIQVDFVNHLVNEGRDKRFVRELVSAAFNLNQSIGISVGVITWIDIVDGNALEFSDMRGAYLGNLALIDEVVKVL